MIKQFPHAASGNTVTETYEGEINGTCDCGERVTKIIGSNFTMFTNGDRYRYTDEQDKGWGIFSCKNCKEPIYKTWKPL